MKGRRHFTKLLFGIPFLNPKVKSVWEYQTNQATKLVREVEEYTNNLQISNPAELTSYTNKYKNYQNSIQSYLNRLKNPYYDWIRLHAKNSKYTDKNGNTTIENLNKNKELIDKFVDVLSDLDTIANQIHQRMPSKLYNPSETQSLNQSGLNEKIDSLEVTSSLDSANKPQRIKLKSSYQKQIKNCTNEVISNLNNFIKFLQFKMPTDAESKKEIVQLYSRVETEVDFENKNVSNTDIDSDNYHKSWTHISKISSTESDSEVTLSDSGDTVDLSELSDRLSPVFSILTLFFPKDNSDIEKTSLEGVYSSVEYISNLPSQEDFRNI